MISSLRARLAALAAALVVGGALVGAAATWMLDTYGDELGSQAVA